MEAKELRLGNFVKLIYGDKPFNVVRAIDNDYISIDEITVDFTTEDEIEPIEITKEWLLKFGFVQRNNRYVFKHFLTFYLKNFAIQIGTSSVFVKIKYVHELQNLHFALTKKEL